MKRVIIKEGTLDKLELELNNLSHYKSILILSCENNDEDNDRLDKILCAQKPTVFGGIFPGLITNEEVLREGYILVGSNERVVVDTHINLKGEFKDRSGMKTVLIFTDGLASNSEQMLESIFDEYGYSLNYLGGGAGHLSFERKPCIFTNIGARNNCTQLVFTKGESGIGVAHGFSPVGESLRVTSAEKNLITGIDYDSAFSVYKKTLQDHCGINVTEENFLDIAKSFPFGISKVGGEFVVRDPLFTKDGDICCIGEVPADSFVQILEGKPDELISAAREAVSSSELGASVGANARFVVDCVSRYLHMEDEYPKELKELVSEKKVTIGILSIGEIANRGNHSIELYNKTCVVGEMKVRK